MAVNLNRSGDLAERRMQIGPRWIALVRFFPTPPQKGRRFFDGNQESSSHNKNQMFISLEITQMDVYLKGGIFQRPYKQPSTLMLDTRRGRRRQPSLRKRFFLSAVEFQSADGIYARSVSRINLECCS